MNIADSGKASLGSLALLYGAPLFALPFLALRWTAGPRWLLDGGWLGTALVAPLLALFAALLLVGPFLYLARPQLERWPESLRFVAGGLFFALPWSAVCYWMLPKGAYGSPVEWALVVGAPAFLASAIVDRHRSVAAASLTFAAAAVVPLFVASDVRSPFVTLWTFGGGAADAFLVLRAAAGAAAVGFAMTAGDPEEGFDDPLVFATALAAGAVVSAAVTPLLGGKILFDGAALSMPFVVLVARRSLRLAAWAPKIAVAQVVASAAVATLALWSGTGEAAAPAAAQGAFAVVVGLTLAHLLDRKPARVRIPLVRPRSQ